jgi:cytochrome c peroxidase
MNKAIKFTAVYFLLIGFITSCAKMDLSAIEKINASLSDPFASTKAAFGSNIDFSNLSNYANQSKPAYITNDNSGTDTIKNDKATLGRILFYDKNLSTNNKISCASCHKQAFAFSDTALVSNGVDGGLTFRHSMRLVNARFSNELKFFWNERAASLEIQTTMPIEDHAELGFSGVNGRGNLDSLFKKLSQLGYYKEAFKAVYGDTIINQARVQQSLAQFIRSIQSFDTKFDAGRALVGNNNNQFPNFTPTENAGKALFLAPPVFDGVGNRISGGAGCNGCHRAPEFDIDPNSRNNGIVGIINGFGIETNNTKSPSLRDLVKADGTLNTSLMHTGQFTSLEDVIGHYNNIPTNRANNNLDNRLRADGIPNKLNLTATEVAQLVAFIKTLGGSNVYTDKKWSNPFLIQ